MPISLMRHGWSKANDGNTFAGAEDDCGLADPTNFRQFLDVVSDCEFPGVTRIIHSGLIRARRSAEMVSGLIAFTGELEVDRRIMEYRMGKLTGQKRYKIASRDLVKVVGAEDPLDFQNRVLAFLREHRDDSGDILVVCHSGVIKAIEAARQGMDVRDFHDIPSPPNAVVLKPDLSWLK